MAKSATAESVADSKRTPQFRSAVQLIRGGVIDVKSRIGQLNEKISEHWAKIEDGYKCNKVGAKMFARLDKLDPDERADAWRTLEGMREASDWPEMRDMVDTMQEGPADPVPEEDAPTPATSTEKPASPKRGKAISPAEAKERAKSHLRVVDKTPPEAPKEVSPNDDADLAGGE